MRIISRSDRPFADRIEAGRCLARELRDLPAQESVVLGIPRGGVIVANEIARALGIPLDIVLAGKLGAPGNPELAIGAIIEGGRVFVDQSAAAMVGAEAGYIEQATRWVHQEMKKRSEICRRVRPKVPLEGKTVVVTDDGVATGSTMQAALWAARQEQPARLIAALPVGPEDTLGKLAELADEVLCLRVPGFFEAVGQFYLSFEQTSDDQVLEVLAGQGGGT